MSSCGPDILLSATNLDIAPDPARPGDAVSFVFRLTLIPGQRFTVSAMIDGERHTSVSGNDVSDGPFTVDVGDAGDLITRYGEGTHTGFVEVLLEDGGRSARTASRSFQLLAQ